MLDERFYFSTMHRVCHTFFSFSRSFCGLFHISVAIGSCKVLFSHVNVNNAVFPTTEGIS